MKNRNINQIPNIKKENLKSKPNNEKDSKFDLLVSPPDQHAPDGVKSPVIFSNEVKIIVDVSPKKKEFETKQYTDFDHQFQWFW